MPNWGCARSIWWNRRSANYKCDVLEYISADRGGYVWTEWRNSFTNIDEETTYVLHAFLDPQSCINLFIRVFQGFLAWLLCKKDVGEFCWVVANYRNPLSWLEMIAFAVFVWFDRFQAQTSLAGFLFDLIDFGPKLVWVDFCLIWLISGPN